MEMVDWAIILVVLISTLISIWRGAIREIFSLATWVIAALVGFKFNDLLVPFFSAFTSSESLQLAGSFLSLVILVVVIGTIIGISLSRAISTVGLTGLDKVLGMVFGCARGVLIVAMVVLFAGSTELPAQLWWKDSLLIPQIEPIANEINDWIKEQGYDSFVTSPKQT